MAACSCRADQLVLCDTQIGDSVLASIWRKEFGHAAIGNHWFRFLFQVHNFALQPHYTLLASQHGTLGLGHPFMSQRVKRQDFLYRKSLG